MMVPNPDVPEGVPFEMTLRLPLSGEGERVYRVTRYGDEIYLHDDVVVADLHPRVRGNVAGDPDSRWPGAQIPIRFDPRLTEACRGTLLEVINALCRVSPVTFRNATEQDRDSVYILQSPLIPGAGQSRVGRAGGSQPLVFKDDPTRQTVVHELLHAAGLHHEHARDDRDEFIAVIEENIEPGRDHNFDKAGKARGGYDLNSAMHYDARAFGVEIPGQGRAETMRLRTPGGGTAPLPPQVGLADWPSPGDLAALQRLYADVGSQFGYLDGAYSVPVAASTAELRGEIRWKASMGAPEVIQPSDDTVDYVDVSVRVPQFETRTWSGGVRREEYSDWRIGPEAVFHAAVFRGGVWRLRFSVVGLPFGVPIKLAVAAVADKWGDHPTPGGTGLPTGRRTFRMHVEPSDEQTFVVPRAPAVAPSPTFAIAGKWGYDADDRVGKVYGSGSRIEKVLGKPDWVKDVGNRLDAAQRRIDDIEMDPQIGRRRGPVR